MNNNQKVFEAVTGFAASHEPCGAAQDYDQSNVKEIFDVVVGTVDNYDFYCLDIDPSEVDLDKISEAIINFHSCDDGDELDTIFKDL